MKHTKKILGALILAATTVSSCVDDSKLLFNAEKPNTIAEMEYLNDYGALKSYVDQNANPDFKLGTGVSVSDYLKKGSVYRLTNYDFDEMTAGNAMKYASCVKDDGSMDFSQVTSFVAAAKEAGISIYGHTLCWHAQQNNKYLNGIIADKTLPGSGAPTLDPSVITNSDFEVDASGWAGWGNNSTRGQTAAGEGFDGTYGFTFTNPSSVDSWVAQIAYDFASSLELGATYVLNFKIKGTIAASITASLQNPDGYKSCGDFPAIPITTDWEEQTLEVVVSGENATRFLFNYGAYVGTILIDDITLCRKNPNGGASVVTKNYVVQSDFENDDALATLIGWGNGSTRTLVNNEGYNGTRCLKVVNPSVTTNIWDVQSGYDFGELVEGETYFLNLKIKGSVTGSIPSAFQKPDGYEGRGDFPSISVTTDWKEITVQTTATGAEATRFLMSLGGYAGTIWIDDFAIYREKKGNSIPLTPEEKADTLIWAMGQWIKGMMKACDGYVKAWDVVNEPMSDSQPSELKSDLTHADASNFYWQDYLSKDYARVAVKLARQYGGDDLKLFINDYNLEAAYNANAKCVGLINMIEYWESDGITKIDGIGTQMHVTYSLNPETQQKNEEAVVNMYTLLAATGKLIKVSELDMGIADTNGETILTENVTEEQHKAMSEYYKFILKKYFEIIPITQRYGITQWAATDSPTDSGWRAGQPIGLWDLSYNRKHTYAGFADGLSNKQ